MAKERLLVVVKPDAMHKSLEGPILTKLAQSNCSIIAAKITQVSRELAEKHYNHIKDKPFFEETIRFILGEFHENRVMALVYEGENAIEKIREIAGETNPEEAAPDTIRGSFGRITTKGIYENVIHASSSPEDAKKEIALWFDEEEIFESAR